MSDIMFAISMACDSKRDIIQRSPNQGIFSHVCAWRLFFLDLELSCTFIALLLLLWDIRCTGQSLGVGRRESFRKFSHPTDVEVESSLPAILLMMMMNGCDLRVSILNRKYGFSIDESGLI